MIYAVEHYLLLGLYAFLMSMVLVNIWTILIKQRRYKTVPLCAFYIFAFIAIGCRFIYTIISWIPGWSPKHYTNDIQLVTKLGVGLIQSWIVFEIALRVRRTYKSNDYGQASAEAFEKWIRYGQYSVVVVSFSITSAIVIADICDLDD